MRLLVFLASFVAWLIIEIAALPVLLGVPAPPISGVLVATGILMLSPGAGLAFACFAGMLLDIMSPAVAPSGVAAALTIFFAVAAFRSFVAWDEPLKKIGALLVGLASLPLGGAVGALVSRVVFGLPVPLPKLSDLTSRPALTMLFVSALWLGAFAWYAVRRFDRVRHEAFGQWR